MNITVQQRCPLQLATGTALVDHAGQDVIASSRKLLIVTVEDRPLYSDVASHWAAYLNVPFA
jgi:hypothetical protein